jgi:hypothetical protein
MQRNDDDNCDLSGRKEKELDQVSMVQPSFSIRIVYSA